MEDRDQIQKPDEDVEAHKKKTHKATATDDGGEKGSEDFELHKKRGRSATDDDSGDDVELHRKNKLTK